MASRKRKASVSSSDRKVRARIIAEAKAEPAAGGAEVKHVPAGAAAESKMPALCTALVEAFSSNGDAAVAKGMAKYLRDQFVCVGLKKPERTPLQKAAFASHPVDSEAELIEVVRALWRQPGREYLYAAMDLCGSKHKLWSAGMFPVLEEMVVTHSWWDTVDCLAGMVGLLLTKFPELKPKMTAWIDDDYMWKRCVAIIHQLKYKDNTDESKLFGFCKRRMHEKEFFIQKAIGWALRQYSRTSKKAVRKFLDENEEGLSTLSKKEGGKYC